MSKESIRLIQITDTHLFASPEKTLLGRNTFDSFKAVVNLVEQHEKNIDLILLTGDLSQDETPESYQHVLRTLKSFNSPIYWIPGNHDNREVMDKVLAPPFNKDKHLVIHNWLIILIDSLDYGKVPGQVSQEELKRIASLISKYPDKYLACFVHHPPFAIHSAWIDNLNLKNDKEFLDTVKKHKHFRLIVSGHVHQEINAFYDDFLFLASPSTSVQFQSFRDEFTLDHLLPGYRWIELDSKGNLMTRVRRLQDYHDNIDYTAKGYK